MGDQTVKWIQKKGRGQTTIGDRGTTRSITSLKEAKRLLDIGAIDTIYYHKKGESQEIIVFGKAGAEEPVIAVIKGNGLLETLAVVNNVEATLIADTDFTRHGVLLLQDDSQLIGLHSSGILFRGSRDMSAMPGTAEQLWQLDLEQLIRTQAPPSDYPKISAEQFAELVLQLNSTSFAGSARPKWDKPAVRLARTIIRNFNNMAPRTIGNTISRGAWRNLPLGFDIGDFGRICEDIAQKRDNPAYLAAHDRQTIGGGSGIGSERLGEDVYFDNFGKHRETVFGSLFLGQFMEGKSGWAIAYGMRHKSAMAAALGKYISIMKGYGWTVKRAICDDASEVGAKFADVAMEHAYRDGQQWFAETASAHGLTVIKMAPEQQRRNKLERSHQTWKADAAGMMASQSNLTIKFWDFCMMDAIQHRNCLLNDKHDTLTPHEQITLKPPDFVQMTRFKWGALATCPRVGPSGLLDTNFEIVAVVHTPPEGHGTYVVLRQGEDVTSIRSGLKNINEWDVERPEVD